LTEGPKRIAQKVGEEGLETALAAVVESDDSLIGEVADLLFHVSVLLRSRGLTLEQVVDELARRHGANG
jgi:phosphoribosyl-ATP pyrophosphohydrolase/phosphoribosyl-AMP cyclohydrolase